MLNNRFDQSPDRYQKSSEKAGVCGKANGPAAAGYFFVPLLCFFSGMFLLFKLLIDEHIEASLIGEYPPEIIDFLLQVPYSFGQIFSAIFDFIREYCKFGGNSSFLFWRHFYSPFYGVVTEIIEFLFSTVSSVGEKVGEPTCPMAFMLLPSQAK